jgi:hypothetical protein
MVEVSSLLDGITTSPPPVDREIEKAFVYGAKATPVDTVPAPVVARAPLSTRIRADFAAALKKASLERQLKNVTPNSLQSILEEAIEPWLKQNGYLGNLFQTQPAICSSCTCLGDRPVRVKRTRNMHRTRPPVRTSRPGDGALMHATQLLSNRCSFDGRRLLYPIFGLRRSLSHTASLLQSRASV